MPVHDADIAAAFETAADLLDLDGANPFRVRAYRNAARLLRDAKYDVVGRLARGEDLSELPGIGRDLAEKIAQVVRTGSFPLLDELRRRYPPGITELLKIQGLGPRRVRVLLDKLGIRTVEQLAQAARQGKIRELPGFGAKTEENILRALGKHVPAGERRYLLIVASQYARGICEYLAQVGGVERVEPAGSLRRARETVGDLDILATSRQPARTLQAFVDYDEVAEVRERGTTRAQVVLRSGIQVDLRVVEPEAWGAAMHYFTGSKAHNIAIRRLGQERGLKINEYGVWRGSRRVAGDTEESVFRSVGLPFIPPELREDRGEIEAAAEGRLPHLVELSDLRGDLHSHTKESDGREDLEAMALAARARGLRYLAVTDHTRRLRVARGLDPRRLRAQMDAIDALNARLDGITLLKSAEVDILEDGTLDLPRELLDELDLVVGAVHEHFDLPAAAQTARVLRAMEDPSFTILAHPTGRLIQERPPYEIDLLRVIRAARERGCFLELDAQPDRLDLSDEHCRLAKDAGVMVSIDSDAHSATDFDHRWVGVAQARRGWLEASDVLNALSLAALRKKLWARRSAVTPRTRARARSRR